MATNTKTTLNRQLIEGIEFHITMAQSELEASSKLSKRLQSLDLAGEKYSSINAEIESLKTMLDIISSYSVKALTSSMNIHNSLISS